MSNSSNSTSPITYKLTETIQNVLKNNIKSSSSDIPELVYANDGSKFFPCKFCCFAFADKDDQLNHMQLCDFKEDNCISLPTEEPPRAKARKSFVNPSHLHRQQLAKLRNNVTKTFGNGMIKSNSHITVTRQTIKPKSHTNDNQPSVIKEEPFNVSFPKIKLAPEPLINFTKLCSACGELFHNKTSLYEHKKEEHPKIYVSFDELNYYDNLFKQSDMTQCTICYKPTIKPQWARHLATHAEEKKYACSMCDRKFRRKDQRNVHEKSHTNETV